eukprot:453537_1
MVEFIQQPTNIALTAIGETQIHNADVRMPDGKKFTLEIKAFKNRDCSGLVAQHASICSACISFLVGVHFIILGSILGLVGALIIGCIFVIIFIIGVANYIRIRHCSSGEWIKHILCFDIDHDKAYFVKQFAENDSQWTIRCTFKLSEMHLKLDEDVSFTAFQFCNIGSSSVYEIGLIVIQLDNGMNVLFNDSNGYVSMNQCREFIQSVISYLQTNFIQN